MTSSSSSGQPPQSHANGRRNAPAPLHQDERWMGTREANLIPSEPSTPAASAAHADDPFAGRGGRSRSSSRFARSRTGSLAESTPAGALYPTASGRDDGKHFNIDTEDEDVKIAIMALGAMRHLDGRSRSNSGEDGAQASTSSYARSVNSTAISSPTSASTPQLSHAHSNLASSSGTVSTASSTPATLADLPPDFQFPAIVHDENGNEMRVEAEDMADADFLKRVSHLPIVRGTLRAYELGKQRSRVMRYGGDLVESSVKAISRPVVSRIGARLGDRGVEQLDDFACRQLNRIYPSTGRSLSKEEKQAILNEVDDKDQKDWQGMPDEERARRRQAYISIKVDERMAASEKAAQESDRGTLARTSSTGSFEASSPLRRPSEARGQVATAQDPSAVVRANLQSARLGSGWGSMLVGAGATAGGLSAAMSEESMKSLKYCLQWLQYATARIEHQITILRDLIVKLNHGELDLSSPAADNLSAIKGDVVATIRGVVDVVGKYAGGALPEPARGSVKAFILSLPARWASVNRAPAAVEGRQGAFGSSPASPSFSSAHMSAGSQTPTPDNNGRHTAIARQQVAATAQAANRVLTLAVESLDILRSVTVVFGESLDRADLWVERLRVLGLQRKRAHEQAAAEEAAARIDAGMGGALARGHSWEMARGLRPSGSESPGAESNMSVGTSASTKRRRTKVNRGRASSNAMSASGASPALHSGEEEEDNASDEGSATETERVAARLANGGSMPTNGRTASSTGVQHQHFQHPHGSTLSMRRSTTGSGKVSGSNGRSAGVVRGPPYSHAIANTHLPGEPTPLIQQLSIADHCGAHESMDAEAKTSQA